MKVQIVIFLVVLAGAVWSCGTTNYGMQRLGIRSRARYDTRMFLKVDIAARANRNNPIAVDLVLVYDPAFLKALMKMSAHDWFAKRDQMKRDHAGAFDVWDWEWVPGEAPPVQAIPLLSLPTTGILFADYLSPGDHRIKIDPRKNATLRLGKDEFTVEPL